MGNSENIYIGHIGESHYVSTLSMCTSNYGLHDPREEKCKASKRKYIQRKQSMAAYKENAKKQKVSDYVDNAKVPPDGREKENNMANIHESKQADNLKKRRASKRKYIQKK